MSSITSKRADSTERPSRALSVFAAKDITFPQGLGVDLRGLEKLYNSLPDAGCNQDVLYNYFDGIRIKSPLKKLFVRIRKKND